MISIVKSIIILRNWEVGVIAKSILLPIKKKKHENVKSIFSHFNAFLPERITYSETISHYSQMTGVFTFNSHSSRYV